MRKIRKRRDALDFDNSPNLLIYTGLLCGRNFENLTSFSHSLCVGGSACSPLLANSIAAAAKRKKTHPRSTLVTTFSSHSETRWILELTLLSRYSYSPPSWKKVLQLRFVNCKIQNFREKLYTACEDLNSYPEKKNENFIVIRLPFIQ